MNPGKTLKDYFQDWIDVDIALFYLYVLEGNCDDSWESFRENKHIFWTNNEICNRLFDLLLFMKENNILESKSESNDESEYDLWRYKQ